MKKTFLTSIAEQFNSPNDLSLGVFVINILLTILLAYIIGLVYTRYGNSLTNRNKQKQNFVLLALIVMLVITVVKSSLALSLGLVGALSIVRFRTAIKEPEELVYFFLAIAIGLGFGANQRIITIVGVFVIIIYIIVQNKNKTKTVVQQNLLLTFSNTTDNPLNENKILDLLKNYCEAIELRRLDHFNNNTEMSLNVVFKDIESILNAKNELKKTGDIQFSFIENI